MRKLRENGRTSHRLFSGCVDSNNIVRNWFAHAHVFIHACDFTNGYFLKGKKLIGSCCTVFQLKVFQKEDLQAGRFLACLFQSMVQEMQDETCGFN